MVVYIAENLENGKKYIGYTTRSLEIRIKEHISSSKNEKSKHYFYLFKQAIRKYGAECFKWDILASCTTKEECCELEKFYIKKLDTITPRGYNLTEGGNGGIQSEETKEKIANAVREYWSDKKELHHWHRATTESRIEWAVKGWETRKENGHKGSFTGLVHSQDSTAKMSSTKNEKGKLRWENIHTGEIVELSLTKMAEYTNLSVGVFNHLKNGKQKQTKCGWMHSGQ
jgi:group I intron endonuclease